VTTLQTHRAFFLLIALAATVFLSDIWAYTEFVRAESYFALGSLSMIERGEWLTPHAPDELQLNKPPLTYWLIGVSYKLFGPSYGAARLPSVLSAFGVLAIVYLLGGWLNGIRAGLMSAATLAFSYLFLTFARMSMSDMLLTLCVTAAFACFIVALTEQLARARKIVLLGYLALALGVLAKGPVAIAIVSIPIGLELAIRRGRGTFEQLRLLQGAGLFLIVAVPYFLLVYAHSGAEPLRFFLVGENLQRFTGQIYAGGARSFWYEPAAFFSDFAPWSPLLFVAAWFDWRKRKENASEHRAARIIYLWLGCTVVLFSISSFKRDYYLLPAMPAAALIVGKLVANGEKLPALARRILAGLLILSSVAILAAALLSVRAARVISAQTPLRFLPLAIALIGVALIVAQVTRQRIRQASLILIGVMWATILSLQWILLPAFVRYLPATKLAAAVPAGRTVFTSYAASNWANSLAFNLPPPHRVERISGALSNQQLNNDHLLSALKNDPLAIAVIWGREYDGLVKQETALKILEEAESYGPGGLSMTLLRHPERDRLLLVARDR
jgi:4-amino-4-deoxy-L-arabinose transferase-like glycosyltransferase